MMPAAAVSFTFFSVQTLKASVRPLHIAVKGCVFADDVAISFNRFLVNFLFVSQNKFLPILL